jgi:hypothetical protein
MNQLFTKIISCVLLIPFVCLFVSCSKDGCSFSSGVMTDQSRNVPAFSQIVLNDKINLILKEDSVQSLIVSANKNLLNGIRTSVTDQVLTIQNDNHCTIFANPADQVNVYISVDSLQKISYYGAGDIYSTNTLNASVFTVDSWFGTGTIKLDIHANQLNAYIRNNNAQIILTGQCNSSVIYCAEEGFVDESKLVSANLALDQRSVRDMYVNVSGYLNAKISYIGNVYYKGNPLRVDSLITNTGKLIHEQ